MRGNISAVISLGVILAAFSPSLVSDVFAQSSAGASKLRPEVVMYVGAGYSAIGPSKISSVRPGVVNLVGIKEYPIDLANKQVTAKDAGGNTVSVSSLRAGDTVYVFRKGDKVIFRVISAQGGSNVR